MVQAAMPEYLWLVIVGAFAAFIFGFGTGANDVANAFGTSVGAKTLTLRQATVIAAIFEGAGGILLGRVVTNTIAGGIADPLAFARMPEAYAYGMVCALTVGGVWQIVASYWGLNVSATHSITGGIIGFALVWGGTGAVQWATPDPRSFPPYRGVVPIIMSWFFSPILTAMSSASIFFIIRTLVLRRKNAFNLAFWVLPPAVAFTTFINIFFVFVRGIARTLGSSWSVATSAWVSACCAAGAAILTIVVIIPLLKWRAKKYQAQREEAIEKGLDPDATPEVEGVFAKSEIHADDSQIVKAMKSMKNAALHGTSVDIHKVVEEDELIGAMHERAEKFDPMAEHVFGYLQVFSAICVIFAHGAAEVGFMAGPLSAIWDIYTTGYLKRSVGVYIWCVLLAAGSLVIGLATYGYNVTRSMGTMMAKLSPSRGFAAEISTALVILVASQLGVPTSSSQAITGGIIGVGLLEGVTKGVNWRFLLKQFASWAATLFLVIGGVAALFAQGVYAPSRVMGNEIFAYEAAFTNVTGTLYSNFNTTLQAYKGPANAGALEHMTAKQWIELDLDVATYSANAARLGTDPDRAAMATPTKYVEHLNHALGFWEKNTIMTLGQNTIIPGVEQCNNNVTADIRNNVTVGCPVAALTIPGVAEPDISAWTGA